MPTAHPRWHRDSVFGPGPRRPLDREQRARFRFLLNAHRRVRRLTPMTEIVGNALVRRLGADGRLDPSHATIANDAGCDERSVRRALEAMRSVGLVVWQRRLVRVGWRVAQATNSYLLALTANPQPIAQTPRFSTGGLFARETPKEETHCLAPVSPGAVAAAQLALAERRRAIETSLLKNGKK